MLEYEVAGLVGFNDFYSQWTLVTSHIIKVLWEHGVFWKHDGEVTFHLRPDLPEALSFVTFPLKDLSDTLYSVKKFQSWLR